MAWRNRKYADAALRLTGLALLCGAALIARHLFAAADPQARARVSPYLFALIGMIAASAGAAMAVLGRHLFDEVELSARWAIHVPQQKGR
jgi:hypothetical protein